MNVRLSLGRVWNTGQGMRTAGWCMMFLSVLAGVGCIGAAFAESTSATQTKLTVDASNAGSRTRLTLTAHVTAQDLSATPTGVVNFRSKGLDRAGELDLGSALLDGEGNASLQTDMLPAGSHEIIAVYQGQPTYLGSASKAEQVHSDVSTIAGFTVAASPTSLSTAVGGFVNSVVTVTPVNGFSGYVSLSCNGLPVNTTCTFTPVNVPANCTAAGVCTPGVSTMQIQTQAPSPGATASVNDDAGMRRFAFVLPALFGLAGLGAAKRRPWRNVALAMLTFAGMMGITACAQRYRYLNHGPPDNPGTPVGSYTITVEAQSSTGSQTTTPPTEPQLTLTVTAPKG